MPIVKQKGILSPTSNPVFDSDVIMTAAIVGHSYERVNAGRDCRYDLELKDDSLLNQKQLDDQFEDLYGHRIAISKINKALANGGLSGDKVQVGLTPIYDKAGNVVRITGGTGNMALSDADRYNPPLPVGLAKDLYDLATGMNGGKIGYQGRGAYTGFVDGRKDGQTALMPTYRHKAPNIGRRWLPSELGSGMGAPFGSGAKERAIWGMIKDNEMQTQIADEGMYFQDQDTQRPVKSGLLLDDVIGYTHGMIQAVYDVVWRGGGTPYEIAVGNDTTKLASCFTCAIFMEATGFPASSTHLGRGESWCTINPAESGNTTQNAARTKCNDQWALYCQKIINRGITCMESKNTNLVTQDHKPSFKALQEYLSDKNTPQAAYDYANLILDAVTIHNSEFKRINATLQP